MKLCLYCGTFNPIHNVHIEVAKFVKEHFEFDKILFIPAYKPPHKNIDNQLSFHRFNMVKLAIECIDGFEISDIEFKREENSYTCNTIEKLYSMYSNIEGKISFIIGTDAFRKIETWYNVDKLKTMIKFIVFPREENFKSESLNYLKENGFVFSCVEKPFEDVSSTELRNLILNKESIIDYVPKNVESYIKEKGLYIKDENDFRN